MGNSSLTRLVGDFFVPGNGCRKELLMWLLDQMIIAPARVWAWLLDRRHDRRRHREARRRQLRAGKE